MTMIPEFCVCFISRVCERPFLTYLQGSGLGFVSKHGEELLFLAFLTFLIKFLSWLFHFFQPKSGRLVCGTASPHSNGVPQPPFPSPVWPKAPKNCGLSFSGLLLHARRPGRPD